MCAKKKLTPVYILVNTTLVSFFFQTDMFKIVEFVESHEVELVPAIWVENGQCYWPNSLRGMALHLAIKNKTPPNCDWGSWEVRTMFSTGRVFELAHLEVAYWIQRRSLAHPPSNFFHLPPL